MRVVIIFAGIIEAGFCFTVSHRTNSAPMNPVVFNLEQHRSTDAVQDNSRVPILGNDPNSLNLAKPHTPSSGLHHETVVHTMPLIKRYPSEHAQQPSNINVDEQRRLLQHPVVSDPMGQYSNCRSINGVIVCADNSVDDSLNVNTPSRPVVQDVGSSHPHSPQQHNHYDHKPIPVEPIPQNVNIASTINDQDCKSLCGINSVCRMINNRPVCGCPVDHTGDPGVRCDPIPKQEETTAGCQKHTDCTPAQICAESTCVDPCNNTVQSPGGVTPPTCGRNAKCTVIHHTPLCGCNEGYSGNPYGGCDA